MQQVPIFTIGKTSYELWEPVHILTGNYKGCLGQVINVTDEAPRKFVVKVHNVGVTLELAPRQIERAS